jgi:hypothetical protein
MVAPNWPTSSCSLSPQKWMFHLLSGLCSSTQVSKVHFLTKYEHILCKKKTTEPVARCNVNHSHWCEWVVIQSQSVFVMELNVECCPKYFPLWLGWDGRQSKCEQTETKVCQRKGVPSGCMGHLASMAKKVWQCALLMWLQMCVLLAWFSSCGRGITCC